MPRLSVLDQSIAIAGRPHAASIQETLALAQTCEQLGYARYWLAEHHNHPTIVGTAPEILLAAIAARTTRIRLGSAGVMLPHYSAYKVAEQFRVLDALAPGRIDLGVGRAPGSDGRTAFALNPHADTAAEQFPAQVRDLMAWVTGSPLPEGHPFRQVRAYPAGETSPDIWVLGSSDYGAQVAAHFGLPYCFAHFITDGRGTAEALDLYRRLYQPSARFPEPIATVCVWAIAADTPEEADRLFTSRAKWRIQRDKGIFEPIEPPETAAAHPFTDAERERIAAMRQTGFAGTAPVVGRKLRTLMADLAIDEAVILTWSHDPQARRRSYELLAAEFDLGSGT
ncbi:MAG: LLM class flavin-dependent oxidoreductase [Hyphomicrobiaceae bacterium]